MRRYSSYTPRSLRTRTRKTKKNLVRNIILAIVLLYLVFAWGIPNLVGGLSFFNKYKPQPPKKVTEDVTLAPPVLNIPFEATNSATLKITGYAAPKTKVNVYLDNELKTSIQTDDRGQFQTEPIPLSLGINNIYGKSVDDQNHTSLPSKTIQLLYSNDKPKLDLSSPADNSQIKGGDKKVTVSGNTNPNNTVTVNSQTAIVQSDGNFSLILPINDGDNVISVTATNPVGNKTQVERKVTYSQ